MTLSATNKRNDDTTITTTYKSRCGTSWTSANGLCGLPCSYDTDCPSGLSCFNGLSPATCSNGVVWNARLTNFETAMICIGAVAGFAGLLMAVFWWRRYRSANKWNGGYSRLGDGFFMSTGTGNDGMSLEEVGLVSVNTSRGNEPDKQSPRQQSRRTANRLSSLNRE
ncbi:hypothetical protein BDR26DRAFT_859778 [Obelidium mucronatum]|nr:hypothetical protein BDR26DRAFT_859778 [Obelidium mucronatum]